MNSFAEAVFRMVQSLQCMRKAAARFFAAAQPSSARLGVQGEDVDLRAY